MSIFSKIKDAKEAAAAEKQEETKKKRPKNSPGLLKKIGVKVEKAPTKDDERALKRHAEEREVWNYIRHQIDVGSRLYLESGDNRILKEYVKGTAFQTIIEKLNGLKSAGVVLAENPNAIAERKENRFEVVSERLNPNGQPNQFTFREQFSDRTTLRSSDGRERSADGTERLIQGTVDVDGDSYQLSSVIRMRGI